MPCKGINYVCELASEQAKPETPSVVQFQNAAAVVAGILAAALEVHREGEVEWVANGCKDDVADEHRYSSHHGENTAVARNHVEEDQSQPP